MIVSHVLSRVEFCEERQIFIGVSVSYLAKIRGPVVFPGRLLVKERARHGSLAPKKCRGK
jgi:hypothetical protein